MNIVIWVLSIVLLVISAIKSKQKTLKALNIAYQKFANIASLFLLVMMGFALLVTYLPPEFMQKYIGIDSGLRGIAIALGIGSITVMPGFAAFPLCGALHMEGIPYYIIAAFSLSLMNVGITTFPLEKKFFGMSVAVIRNALSLLVCIVAVFVVKLIFGE